MIVPMRKYTFLVFHRDYTDFLDDLQRLGVLHIIKSVGKNDPQLKEKNDVILRYTQVLKTLAKRKVTTSEPMNLSAEEILSAIDKNTAQADKLRQQLASVDKDLGTLAPWGSFSRERLNALRQYDVYVDFYSCTLSRFKDQWAQDYSLEVISQDNTNVYFVVMSSAKEEVQIEADKVRLPEVEKTELLSRKQQIEAELKQIDAFLDQCAGSGVSILNDFRDQLFERYEYTEAELSTLKEADDMLMILRGWVSVPNEATIKAYLDEKEIYYTSERPVVDEPVPILLKNRPFGRLFEVIGKMYSLPSYGEMDLTAFFAPFFMLFFGFCTADAAYGIILITISTIAKFKIKDPKVKPLLSLVQVLGTGTLIMGLVMGSLLGFDMKEWSWIGDKIPIRNNSMVFNFALLLGAIQILFGVAMNFVNRVRMTGFKSGIVSIGTFLFILSVTIMGSPQLGANPGIWAVYAKYTMYLSLFLIFFFNSPGMNIFLQFAKGFWEMYNIITGYFGDLLSYIRLFALGVSGGILGFVVNTMAFQFKEIPVAGPLVFILIMVLGHSVNIGLSCLGGFVHPMRLTFVEFYKNSGFAGGGKEYKPFGLKK